MEVKVVLREPLLRDVAGTWIARTRCVLAVQAAHVRQRRCGGLLHHVAELARDLELAVAGIGDRLDEQHVAAEGRPGEAGRHAGLARAPPHLGLEARLTEQVRDRLRADGPLRAARALGELARHLAADRADLALERAHAGLARVAVDDPVERRLRDLYLRPPKP